MARQQKDGVFVKGNFETNWTYVVLPCHRVGYDDVPHRRVVIVNFGRCSEHKDIISLAVDYVQEYVISGGDEEFWGFSFGSQVEHAGDGHYYVPRDPDADDADDFVETEYEHCEVIVDFACVVHSIHKAIEEAYTQGDTKPYTIKYSL